MSSIYEEPFKAALLTYRMDNLGRFQTEPPEVDPNDGPALKAAIEHATKMVAEIPQQEPKPFEFDFNRLTEDQLAAPMAIYSSKRAAADEAYEAELTRLNAAYQEQVASAQAASEASVSGLTKMYDELLTYKDKVRDAVMRYDIKPSDLAIDEDKLTREDMEALVQTALTACKNLGGDSGLRPKLKHIFDKHLLDTNTMYGHKVWRRPVAGPVYMRDLGFVPVTTMPSYWDPSIAKNVLAQFQQSRIPLYPRPYLGTIDTIYENKAVGSLPDWWVSKLDVAERSGMPIHRIGVKEVFAACGVTLR